MNNICVHRTYVKLFSTFFYFSSVRLRRTVYLLRISESFNMVFCAIRRSISLADSFQNEFETRAISYSTDLMIRRRASLCFARDASSSFVNESTRPIVISTSLNDFIASLYSLILYIRYATIHTRIAITMYAIRFIVSFYSIP